MTHEQLNTALYEKVYAEQQEFISSLKTMTPENIIQYAYELVIREDILLSFEENEVNQKHIENIKGSSILLLGIATIFFVLLIYTLFFALPFDKTYQNESEKRMAYTEGVYALCRHPGVLWFIGFY